MFKFYVVDFKNGIYQKVKLSVKPTVILFFLYFNCMLLNIDVCISIN